jgi:MYXO-CTERM domain-containing protein
MYLTTDYWGIFVRDGNGPWSWICDEALNDDKQRKVAVGGDGTLYATNVAGISISRDAGCSWSSAPGGIADRVSTIIVADPLVSTRVWVAAMKDIQTELWESDDAGQSWAVKLQIPTAELSGVAVAPDGQTVYLVAIADIESTMPDPRLYTSQDAGKTFSSASIAPLPADVSAVRVGFLGLDERAPGVIYVRSQAGVQNVLLRAKPATGELTEVLRISANINSATVDRANDRLLIGTTGGAYHAEGMQPPQLSAGLTYAPCVAVHEGKTYACSNDGAPNNADIAISSDGAQSFQRLFQFSDTKDIAQCPRSTPVAKLCPDAWLNYGGLLGIKPMMPAPIDMAQAEADMGTSPSPPTEASPSGCACTMGAPPPQPGWLGVVAWVLLGLALGRRRIGVWLLRLAK